MLLKIKRNWREEGEYATEIVLECERYDIRPYDVVDKTANAAESLFCGAKGEVDSTLTLFTFKQGKLVNMLLLGFATIFVMNNEGKTIDIIYT